MTKRTKALSGASQDAYFRRVFKAHSSLAPEERDRLVHLLRREIAQLRLRRKENMQAAAAEPPAAPVLPPPDPIVASPEVPAQPAAPPFDPFSLNIVLLVRTAGRDGALAALQAIDSLDNLRLLAREQRLSIAADVASPAELRTAIIQAAERRIANRIAAAS